MSKGRCLTALLKGCVALVLLVLVAATVLPPVMDWRLVA
jgi:hypothetical protein